MKGGKGGIVLALVTGVGLVITVVLTAKKAPEAQKAKEAALEEKREATGDPNAQLTKMESIKAQAPCYIPVACSAAGTMASLVGSQILPQGALNNLEKWKRTYRDISAKVNGPQAEKLISQMTEKTIESKEDGMKMETFILPFNDENIIIEATMLDILMAEYDVNRFFKGTGAITFNQLLDFFPGKLKHRDRGDEFGWNEYLGDAFYGYCWIDFYHRQATLDGKPVTFIDMPFLPHSLNEDDVDEILNHGIE